MKMLSRVFLSTCLMVSVSNFQVRALGEGDDAPTPAAIIKAAKHSIKNQPELDQFAFIALTTVKNNPAASAREKIKAGYFLALLGQSNRIDLIDNETTYRLFAETASSPHVSDAKKLKANFLRAAIRVSNKTNALSDADANLILEQVSANPLATNIMRLTANFNSAMLGFQKRVGHEVGMGFFSDRKIYKQLKDISI